MARLIDVDELLESIEETTWYHIFNGKLIQGANSKTDIPLYKASDIYSVLDAAPTIDAEPVRYDNMTLEDAQNLYLLELITVRAQMAQLIKPEQYFQAVDFIDSLRKQLTEPPKGVQ